MTGMTLRRPSRSDTGERRWAPAAFLITTGAAIVGLSLSVLLVGGLVSFGTETVEQSFEVGPSPRLVIDGRVGGNVTIRAGSAGSISVDAHLQDERRIDFVMRQDGDAVRIESREGAFLSFLPAWRRTADIAVTAPAGTVVEVRTEDGSVEVDGLDADAILKTTNGSIRLGDVRGNIVATTTNGRVTFDGAVPAGVTTQLSTTNGRLELRASEIQGTLDAKTTNGRVTFEGPLAGGAQVNLKTTNGRVEVKSQGTPDVTVDLDTSNGSATSKWPVLATTSDDDTLRGTIGNGSATLTVRNSNGPITIE